MLRNPNGASFAAVFLLGAVIVADLFSLFADLRLRAAAAEPFTGDVSGLDLAMAEVGAAGLAQALALLGSVVTFLIWFYRVRLNAQVWAPDLHRHTPGWAIGAWFVPIVGLWFPHRIAVDIWRASRAEPTAADRPGELGLLNGWWTLFLAGWLADRLAARVYTRAETPDAYENAAYWFLASDALDIVSAVLAILLVRRLTSMQNAKAAGRIPAAR